MEIPDPGDLEHKKTVLRQIWPGLSDDTFDLRPYRYFIWDVLDSHENLEEILLHITRLRDNASIMQYWQYREVTLSELCIRAPEIAASVWLPLKISITTGLPPDSSVRWIPQETLVDAIRDCFTSKLGKTHALESGRQLPRNFTLSNLCGKYHLSFSWTHSLSDHLSLDIVKRQVRVYKHPICLQNHLNFSSSCPIEKPALEEALDTLALLLPTNDNDTATFLGSEMADSFLWVFKKHPRDRILELNRYEYWRGNLLQLLDQVDQVDRLWEQKVTTANQWFTWVVGIFAVVSTALSIVSIVVAYKANAISARSLDLAAAQFELSVAELCREDDIVRKLPRHCGLLETASPGHFRSSLMDEDEEL
jgi:hypothetical protein